MKQLLRMLIVQPVESLLRFKSFFLLMFLVTLGDHMVKHVKFLYHLNLILPRFWRIEPKNSAYMLFQMPGLVVKRMGSGDLFLILAGLFLLRQMLLLWPSSDLRRMHRAEREPFGLAGALKSITWKSVLFHISGLSAAWIITGLWCLGWFWINRFFWRHYQSGLWLWSLFFTIILILPLLSAALSYSSRLAVNSEGTFTEKFKLLCKLFTGWRIMAGSWLFFTLRFILRAIFVVAVPIYILVAVEKGPLKIFLLTLLTTPVSAYLETVSFKIFLAFYKDYPIIWQEYEIDYRNHINNNRIDEVS